MSAENNDLRIEQKIACVEVLSEILFKDGSSKFHVRPVPPEYEHIIITKSWRLLPFLKFPALRIGLTYQPDTVKALHPKYEPLVRSIRADLTKLWRFGRDYNVSRDSDFDKKFAVQVILQQFLMTKEQPDVTPTLERHRQAVQRVCSNQMKDAANAKN